MLDQGATNQAIAAETGVSTATVSRERRARGALTVTASAPFSGGAQPGAMIPAPNYNADQPPPPPREFKFDPRYHGHTFRAPAAPLAFSGWSLERIRAAIDLHDQGYFLESSMLAIVASRFGPVFAALSQAIAPALGLPRHVRGGVRGLARILRDEIEAQLAPRSGLLPSPHFPPWLWGSAALDLRMMGFSVLQHAYGDEDPVTGVRPIYTRRWPTWATQYYRYRRTFVAITTDGPVDIISGDGKFTLLADTEEPHFEGAIRALGVEVLDGTLVKQARNSYVDRYGNPKWVGIMPPNVGTRTKEGDDFFDALRVIQGPDGYGALPNGSTYGVVQMTSSQSTVFKDALDNVWQFCAAIILGSDGTLSKGTGVYTAPVFAGVARHLVNRVLKCLIRGVNMGHIAPYLACNYAASIEAASGWIDPVLDIPLPDPEADARIDSYTKHQAALVAQMKAEREAGFLVDQERVNLLAEKLDVEPPTLAPVKEAEGKSLILSPTGVEKIALVDEGRASQGLKPIAEAIPGDTRGALFISEVDKQAPAAAPNDAATAAPATPAAPAPSPETVDTNDNGASAA